MCIRDSDKGAALNTDEAPKKDGYVFKGWYTDSSFKNAFKTGTTISENISLFAKYEAAENGGGCQGIALGSFCLLYTSRCV